MSRERIRLPADVEMEDRLAWGLTARQLLILAATALISYGIFWVSATSLPVAVAGALAAPPGLFGVALALGRRDGLSGDRLALAATRHLIQSPRRVAAPDGLPFALPHAPAQPGVSLLRVPVRSIRDSGVVELADGTSALLLAASATSWSLRSQEEQAALAEAYGKWLNSLIEPTLITVTSERVDLAAQASAIERAADGLPHPALARSASTYAHFLVELANRDEGLRRRQILLVLSTKTRERQTARAELERRAAETQALLHGAGVALQTLDGTQAAALLLDSFEHPGPPLGSEIDGVVRAC